MLNPDSAAVVEPRRIGIGPICIGAAVMLSTWGCSNDPVASATVSAVVVTPESVTLVALGESVPLTATAVDANGDPIAGKSFVWTSLNDVVATVDGSGSVTAMSNGLATVRATADGVGGEAEITVAQAVSSLEVGPSAATLAFLGETLQMLATPLDANGNAIMGKLITWSSDDENVAIVTSGLVTAVGNGSAVITAAVDGVEETEVVSVDQLPASLEFAVEPASRKAGLSITPSVEVEVLDAGGSLITDGTDPVTLTIGTNPAGGILFGSTTINAAAGVASFNDLSIDQPGSGYTLVASSGTLSSTESQPFLIGACPCAYVVSELSNVVSEIELSSHESIGTVAVGSNPKGIAITPDGAYAFVTNAVSLSVSVIDIATDQVVSTIALGVGAVGVGIKPDGSIAYTANRFSSGFGSVTVIDVSTRTVLETIAVGGPPLDLAFTPDGASAYVTHPGQNSVSVIDVAGASVAGTIVGLVGGPTGIALSPSGGLVYVGTNEPSKVHVIETAGNTVVETVDLDLSPVAGDVAVTPDGAQLFVASDDQVKVISTANNAVIASVEVGLQPMAIALTPDGARAYVAHGGLSGPSVISVIETVTHAIVDTFIVPGTATAIAITP